MGTALRLFLLIFSLAAVSFGGGNTLLAGLERELVPTGLISPAQFASAVALGQSTPGPLAAFTTAIGSHVMGLTGAIAATLGLVAVSLVSVAVIQRLPVHWFENSLVKAGIGAVPAYACAIIFFLAYRMALAGNHTRWAAPVGILITVLAGRHFRLPTAIVMLCVVGLGMLTQGTGLAGW